MAVRRLAPVEIQPKRFAFSAENLEWAKAELGKYPHGRQESAVLALLWRAQAQAGGQEVSLFRGALPEASSASLAAQLLGKVTTVTDDWVTMVSVPLVLVQTLIRPSVPPVTTIVPLGENATP